MDQSHRRVLIICSSMVGNVLEHYDKSLFVFLVPFLSPLFFPPSSSLTPLILTYGLTPLGILSRPIGALVFGKIGDKNGYHVALFTTLIGMAVTTCLMGFLPHYAQAGMFAPIWLIFLRLAQHFFAAGEVTGGALLMLKYCDAKKRSLFSALYDCSSMVGILIASLAISCWSRQENLGSGWRFFYWAGSLTALVGLLIRIVLSKCSELRPIEKRITLISSRSSSSVWQLWRSFPLLCAIAVVTGCSYAIYECCTSLMNVYVSLFSEAIILPEAFKLNSWLLLLDCALLPICGLIFMKCSKQKVMGCFALMTALFILPLILCLRGAGVMTVVVVRTTLVCLGVGFSAPLYAWMHEVTPKAYRYTLISMGTMVGHQLIGGSMNSISLWLYQATGWMGMPALYLIVVSLCACLAIFKISKGIASSPLPSPT